MLTPFGDLAMMLASSSHGARAMQIGEMRLRTRRRPGLSGLLEEAALRQAFQPFDLAVPLQILEPIRDVILELPVFVEDQDAPAEDSNPAVARNFLGRRYLENRLELASPQ